MAVDRDPHFALAWAGMADSWAYLAENFAAVPKEVMPKAKAAAERALELDPNSAEAHTSAGIVKLDYEWNRDAAQREFLWALELNPGSALGHHWYAHSLETQERLDDATMARRYNDVLTLLRKGDELFPNFLILSWEKVKRSN
ncbi:MAG TPA: hypothetical protein VG297_16585 [Bryobacteraceae bacterium]|jgi:tetratricopeptide (TPR) repeat protein|nr:hypothetical protein [Bryobacteraceae bacterium]